MFHAGIGFRYSYTLIVITSASREFVGSLVGSFVRYVRCDFLTSIQVRFLMKFGVQHPCQSSLLTFERTRSKI